MKILDCCVQGQGHGIHSKFSDCLCGWYLLNIWTFCNQTWYGGTSLRGRVSHEKYSCYGQGHREGLYNHKPKCLVKILGWCDQGHGHSVSEWSEFQLIFEYFVIKPGLVIYHHKLGCHVAVFTAMVTGLIIVIQSKYDSFYCIFWTNFASRLWWCIIIRLSCVQIASLCSSLGSQQRFTASLNVF